MPVDEVHHRKEARYYELLPELKAVPEVLAHIEAAMARFRLRWYRVARGSRW